MTQQSGIPPVNGTPGGSPFARGAPRSLRGSTSLSEGLQKLAAQRDANPTGTADPARTPAPAASSDRRSAERQPQAQAHAGQAPQSGPGRRGERRAAEPRRWRSRRHWRGWAGGGHGPFRERGRYTLHPRPAPRARGGLASPGRVLATHVGARGDGKGFSSGLEEVQKHGAVIKAGAERVPQLLSWVLQQAQAAQPQEPDPQRITSDPVGYQRDLAAYRQMLQHHQATLGQLRRASGGRSTG
jgi:hypothetical protein